MQQWVYHSSPVQGLSLIKPSTSTHGERWVYACRSRAIAAAFLGRTGGDLTCSVGRDGETGTPYICERFNGAFDLRYQQQSGSIYTLFAEEFTEGLTSWDEEVVSPVAVRPVDEQMIDCAKEYLLQLQKQGELIIKRYPDRVAGIPADDEDLVMRGILWSRASGDSALQAFEEYHPHLLGRIRRGLREGRYQDEYFGG